ncbi:hypothetical protein PVAND_015371 [Polypedilum vanderplanki]|uniref:C2H2-type domain-containing protein n=1 Tax=Polypedilum vanderplanki TaxID=319348 RepID=A0A9J6BCU9_POLVA|nr:hypothetical protein PVAND_015371 [Polypedilum vanderplanki]
MLRIIREFDNLWLLRDVEFETIRQYSAKVGSKYLRNIDAGGIYYNDVMDQKGMLYVLNFDNEVDPDPNVKGPTRGFDNRDVQHYPKHVPKYTPLPSFDVPLFRDNFPSYSKALMIKFGYVLRKSSLEKSLEESGLLKCVECAYSTDNSHNLAVHKNRAHNVINFECTLCGKTAKTKNGVRRHAKFIHDEDIDPNYICVSPNCGEKFTSSQKKEAYGHARIHRQGEQFKQEIATQDNIEKYDNMVRQHEKRPELDYTMNDGTKYLAVEYVARND